MAKRYGIWKKRFKSASGEEKTLYYACSKRGNVICFKGLSKRVTELSSLSEGDIMSTLLNVATVMKWKLIDGDTVRLDGIGSFSIAVTSDGFEDPKEITPNRVRASKVVFIPDMSFVRLIEEIDFYK